MYTRYSHRGYFEPFSPSGTTSASASALRHRRRCCPNTESVSSRPTLSLSLSLSFSLSLSLSPGDRRPLTVPGPGPESLEKKNNGKSDNVRRSIAVSPSHGSSRSRCRSIVRADRSIDHRPASRSSSFARMVRSAIKFSESSFVATGVAYCFSGAKLSLSSPIATFPLCSRETIALFLSLFFSVGDRYQSTAAQEANPPKLDSTSGSRVVASIDSRRNNRTAGD